MKARLAWKVALAAIFLLSLFAITASASDCNLLEGECSPPPDRVPDYSTPSHDRATADVLYYADFYVGEEFVIPALEEVGLSVYQAASWGEFNALLDVDRFPTAVALNQNFGLAGC